MKNIIVTILAFCLANVLLLAQNDKPQKIELTKDGTLYYSTSSEIIKVKDDTIENISLAQRFTSFKFNDFTDNRNFIINKNFLITLHIYKASWSQEGYKCQPWHILYECRDLNRKYIFRKSILETPARNGLRIPNFTDIALKKDKIYYDFVDWNSKIFLLLSVGENAFLYESIGPVEKNNWELIHSYQFTTPLKDFFLYVHDKSVILRSINNASYRIVPDRTRIEPFQEQSNKDIRVFNHVTKKYTLLDSITALELIQSNNPEAFLAFLKNESKH